MRKLVTLRKIDEIVEHQNADAIELAIIDGWQVVVKKGEFQEGDPCIFFEIDSFLPADDKRFEFLIKSGLKKDESGRERIRLKTVKLRGELSQGLALPWHQFPELHEQVRIVDDFSEMLDVIKYERPEPNTPEAAGNFPSFLIKTDESRIQNVWKRMIHQYADTYFIPTLKLDGTSCSIGNIGEKFQHEWKNDEEYSIQYSGGEIFVTSRNLQIKVGNDSHFMTAITHDNIVDKLINITSSPAYAGRSLALQGEVMGPGIQGNKEKLLTYAFFAFNVFDIDNQQYLSFEESMDIFEEFEIPHVPVIGKPLQVFKEFSTLKELLDDADGPSMNAKLREGIVWKSVGLDKPVSFKCISNKWLIKSEE